MKSCGCLCVNPNVTRYRLADDQNGYRLVSREDEPTSIEVSNPFLRPLVSQRYFAALSSLNEARPDFVLDIGCCECGFLFYLSRRPGSLRFGVGLDKDKSALARGHKVLNGPVISQKHSRTFPVSLFCEDVTKLTSSFVKQFKDAPFVTMLELIEHLSPEELRAAESQVFGLLQPHWVFLTTPNIEYNGVLSSAFSGSRGEGAFRHWDHHFEWTRREFGDWCERVASEFGYSCHISGIGRVVDGSDDGSVGFASHSVLFERKEKVVGAFAVPSDGCFLANISVDARVNPVPGFTPQPTPEPSDEEWDDVDWPDGSDSQETTE
jgi:hypothetical protein